MRVECHQVTFRQVSGQFGICDVLFLYAWVVRELLLIAMKVLRLLICRPMTLRKDPWVYMLLEDARGSPVAKPFVNEVIRIRCRRSPSFK